MGCFLGWLTVVGAAVLGWLVWRSVERRRELERRLGALEATVAEIETRMRSGSPELGTVEAASTPLTSEPRPAPEPAEPLGADDGVAEPEPGPIAGEGDERTAVAGARAAAAETAPKTISWQGDTVHAERDADDGAPPAGDALPPEPPKPPPAERPQIDWEQWVGVRGAAVLGAVVLALAGIYFVRYSIQAGWFPPAVRVALGLLAGVGAIGTGEVLRKRGYSFAADGLAGAGIVLLYAATWAGRALYSLFGTEVAFVLMAIATAAGGVLSWRHRSRVIALLGLAGGFATPILVSSGSDRPIGLFGYLLLLNAGVAFLTRRGGWSFLGALALLGTVLYQALWISERMGDRMTLGLGILAVFALFYVAIGWLQRSRTPDLPADGEASGERLATVLQQVGALLTPTALAFYFATQSELSDALWPIALLLFLLNAASLPVAWIHRLPSVVPAVAAASLAVVGVWTTNAAFDQALALQLSATLLAIALIHHAGFEWRARRGAAGWAESLAALVTAGFAIFWLLVLWLLVDRVGAATYFWIGFGSSLLGAALLLRQSLISGRRAPEIAAGGLVGLHLAALLLLGSDPQEGRPGFTTSLVVALATGALFQAWSFFRGRQTSAAADAGASSPLWKRVAASRGVRELFTILPPLLALLGLWGFSPTAGNRSETGFAVAFHLGGTLLALLAVLSATRARSGLWYGLALLLLAVVQLTWTTWAGFGAGDPGYDQPLLALALQLLAVALFTFWPLLARLDTAGTRRAAALAGPAWFLSLYQLYREALGDETIGLLALTLGALSLFAGYGMTRLAAQRASEQGLDAQTRDRTRRSTLAWFGAVALGFVALAIPLQLDQEWVTVGWSLQALAVTALWQRVDHAGLKYFAAALFAAVVVRLIANPALFEYHPSGSEPFGLPVLNWLLYTYLVPAAALVLAARILEPRELERAREAERPFYRAVRDRPALAGLFGLAAIAVTFVWINLTIFDAFSSGGPLAVSFDRQPARDLVLSLSWALFAISLLLLGVVRKSGVLRWISLAFFLITIGKVFLYDLGELTDLFRVASLVGLAFSLIIVSLLYQRFVFGRDRARRAGEPAAGDQPDPAP